MSAVKMLQGVRGGKVLQASDILVAKSSMSLKLATFNLKKTGLNTVWCNIFLS
jgi:hypothetical protein